ncbi:MAG: NADPH:quinone oxidoreductase family protein [Acidimicrobiales bacterium]|nr:NADPH:quinone oxidoreductase family protein [Acidimicrobiales bacterium]MCB9396064.1 NADPH:quinone oxidoreductase family protein [Acidimicrobiaceae bacterium]
MRSIVCVAHGTADNFVIEEAPTPKPEAGQVLVRIEAAGASFVDALQAAGKYQFAAAPPYVPGGESAGVIEALGADVAGWSVGDRVLVQSGRGAFATHIVVSPLQLIRLPDGVSADVGASFLQVYGTAWFALKKRTVVRPGEVVLVTGAGGGVGLAAIDVARSMGARVIGVASSEEKRALALGAGAESVIDPLTEDVKTRARELTDGAGVDVVYDVAGGPVSEPALRALRFDGRFLVVGFPGGIASVPLNLVLLNNRTVVGIEWGGWVPRHAEENRAMIGEIVEAIAAGDLRPVTPARRPLDDARAVLTELLDRQAAGKIVLVP